MRLWRKKKTPSRGFIGDWNHRIGDLFRCGIEFRDRTVLDAGCNMGILAYEIAKHEPKFIHGIDRSIGYIRTAQMIFLGVALDSQFDRLDMSRAKELTAALRPSYDIVLFLSVYQHLRNAYGVDLAQGTLRTLLARCHGHFVFRVPQAELAEADAVIIGEGFVKTFTGDVFDNGTALLKDRGVSSRFHVYRRQTTGSSSPAPDKAVRA